MSILNIRQYPDPVLREVCQPITEITPELRQLLNDMAETMYHANGIGLAAPQIGKAIRAIVVDVGEDNAPELYKLINPEIVNAQGICENEEGCLSIPDIRDFVKRSEKITIKALDPNGKEVLLNADGLFAICLQHEIDHLNGVLFIDHLSRLKRELIKKQLKKLSAKD